MNRRERRALGKPADVEGLMAEAGRLHGQGRLREEAALYARIAALRPEMADVYFNWGQALAGLGRQKEAASVYRQALARRPEDAEAWNNLAAALLALNALGEAEQALLAALHHRPDYRAALTNLALVRLGLGQSEGAAALLSRLIERDGGREDSCLALAGLLPGEGGEGRRLTQLAILLLRGGRQAQALQTARHAAKRLGPSDEAHFDLGVLFARCGAEAEAEPHLRRALLLDPEDSLGARLQLAALGLDALPAAASAAQIGKIYAMRAASWDEADQRTYHGAQLVAEKLLSLPGGVEGWTLLDAGCGTGLVGARIAGMAARLEGVDLSAAMLERAARP
jgi:predicted TPR repeat methyltransferase